MCLKIQEELQSFPSFAWQEINFSLTSQKQYQDKHVNSCWIKRYSFPSYQITSRAEEILLLLFSRHMSRPIYALVICCFVNIRAAQLGRNVQTTSHQRRCNVYKRHMSAETSSEKGSSNMRKRLFIPCMRKVSSGHLFSIDTFCCVRRFC